MQDFWCKRKVFSRSCHKQLQMSLALEATLVREGTGPDTGIISALRQVHGCLEQPGMTENERKLTWAR